MLFLNKLLIIAGSAVLIAGCQQQALDADAVARGRDAMENCTPCHVVTERRNHVGPHLVGIIGRKAGQVKDFVYSEAMVGSGIEWTPELLKAFIIEPAAVVPDTNMAVEGIDPETASDVVTYLRSLAR